MNGINVLGQSFGQLSAILWPLCISEFCNTTRCCTGRDFLPLVADCTLMITVKRDAMNFAGVQPGQCARPSSSGSTNGLQSHPSFHMTGPGADSSAQGAIPGILSQYFATSGEPSLSQSCLRRVLCNKCSFIVETKQRSQPVLCDYCSSSGEAPHMRQHVRLASRIPGALERLQSARHH